MISRRFRRAVIASRIGRTMVGVCVALGLGRTVAAQGRPAARARVAPAILDTTQPPPAYPLSVRVGSDTVTVGDPFTLVVSIDVPTAATVQWPVASDTAASVQQRATVRVVSTNRGADRRETATYIFSAWDLGSQAIRLGNIVVRDAGQTQRVSLGSPRINVKTVLPLDTALHVPKPARDLFPRHVPWWEAWWPAAAVVAALGLLWWLWRRMKRRVVKTVTPTLDLFARAMQDFDRLQRLGLADGGERGRAVVLATEVLRAYLAARAPGAALALTSDELLTVVARDARVPQERLASLLVQCDAIKFAHRALTLEEARALQAEARAVVEAIEATERAQRQAIDAERRAREEAERASRAADEDAARRRSRRPKAGAS